MCHTWLISARLTDVLGLSLQACWWLAHSSVIGWGHKGLFALTGLAWAFYMVAGKGSQRVELRKTF